MDFSVFLHFSLHLEATATMATMTLHASSRGSFGHVGRLKTASASNQYKKIDLGVQVPLQPFQKLY
jgi:hypothetical protein